MKTALFTMALLASSATAIAQPQAIKRFLEPVTADTVEGLQELHIATLKEKAEVSLRMYESGQELLHFVLKAHISVLDAELEYSNIRADRVRYAEASVESLKALERMVLEQFASGAVPQLEVLRVRASRLQAEIVLMQEKRKMEGAEKRDSQIDGRNTVGNSFSAMCVPLATPQRSRYGICRPKR